MAVFVEDKVYQKRCSGCNRLIEYTSKDIRSYKAMDGGSPYEVWYVTCPDNDCNRYKNGHVVHKSKHNR